MMAVGEAGIGKSALAYALAERWSGPTLYGKVGAEPLAVSVNDARRQLADGEPVTEMATDSERLVDLARRLDERTALWVIDDLHRLPPASRGELLRVLGASLRHGRVVATTRERAEMSAGDPDRFELVLRGLDDARRECAVEQLQSLLSDLESG